MAVRCSKCQFENSETQRFCGECGTPLSPPGEIPVSQTQTLETPREEFAPGSIFAQRYQIIKELGRGGMGRVFLAHDKKLDRDVALKFLADEIQKDDRARERFLREARSAAALDHPFICKIYDTGEMNGKVFIAMEFAEGQNLRESAGGEALPLGDTLQVMSEIAEALEKAHEKGIIHRDLKPENIMLTPQGHAKVMDFGIAKVMSKDDASSSITLTKDSITKEGSIVGTLAYMSPEQARGDRVDNRSDIYSWGVIFYELLSGKPPFSRPTAAETLSAILRDPPPPLKSIPKTFNLAVSNILRQSLAKDPQSRYTTVAELASDIKNLQRETVVASLPLLRKQPLIVGTMTFLFLILVGTLWFAWLKNKLFIKKTPDPVSILIADFQNKTGDPVLDGSLEEALGIGLEGAPFINLYKRGEAKKLAGKLDATRQGKLDADFAQVIAGREAVNIVITGMIESSGQNFTIKVRAIDPIRQNAFYERSKKSISKADLLRAIDDFAYRIRKKLGEIPKDSSQKHLIEIFTTKSLEAMYAYAKGQELQSQGKFNESIEAYQLAIDKDPDFGRAYSGLASSYNNIGEREKAIKNIQQAVARVDNMTDREKFRTRGVYYLMTGNWRKAIDEYSMLVNQFPADNAGLTNLGMAYWGVNDYHKAIKYCQDALKLRPEAIGYRNLAQYALEAGDFKLAEESALKAIEINPEYSQAYPLLAKAQIAAGRFEDGARTWQRFGRLGEKMKIGMEAGLLLLALYESRLKEAKSMLERAIISDLESKEKYRDSSAASRRVILAEILVLQGREALALKELARALRIIESGEELFSAAQIYLKSNQKSRAVSLAAMLKKKLPDMNKFEEFEFEALAKIIEAEINISNGKIKEAKMDIDESIRLLQEAKALYDRWTIRFYLGYAYLKSEAFTEAHSEFELCLKRRGEAFAYGESQRIPLIYYYLGQVQEALNSHAASESYERFLEIKRRSDGDLTVEDAKRRLASLALMKNQEKK